MAALLRRRAGSPLRDGRRLSAPLRRDYRRPHGAGLPLGARPRHGVARRPRAVHERADDRVNGEELALRRYERRDFDRVVELHLLGIRQVGANPGRGAWDSDLATHEALVATYLDTRGDFVVGERDGTIVAIGGIRPFDDTRAEMKRVRVDPDHQRRGFGEAIVGRLEHCARELGYAAMHLDTTTLQQPAIKMYEKLGY